MKANVLRNICGLLGLFIVTLFSSSAVFAQKNRCELRKQSSALGSPLKIASPNILLGGKTYPLQDMKHAWNVGMYFFSEGDSLYLAVYHGTTGDPSSIAEFSTQLTNGKIVKKNNASTAVPQTMGDYDLVTTFFPISQNELQEFSSNGIVKVSAVFSSFLEAQLYADDVKEKVMEKVLSGASCLINEISTQTAKL
ncbi:MAG TPA: hypothetical protein VGE18_03255 [Candidatus Paceibacterota bacterium]